MTAALTITASDITAMMVAITALVTAIGIAIVNIMSARATLKKVSIVETKVDEVAVQGKVIEGHVNGASQAAAAKLVGLENEVRLLRETVAGKDQTAAVLAEATAALARESNGPTGTA